MILLRKTAAEEPMTRGGDGEDPSSGKMTLRRSGRLAESIDRADLVSEADALQRSNETGIRSASIAGAGGDIMPTAAAG